MSGSKNILKPKNKSVLPSFHWKYFWKSCSSFSLTCFVSLLHWQYLAPNNKIRIILNFRSIVIFELIFIYCVNSCKCEMMEVFCSENVVIILIKLKPFRNIWFFFVERAIPKQWAWNMKMLQQQIPFCCKNLRLSGLIKKLV